MREFWIADLDNPQPQETFLAYNYDPFLGPFKKIHVQEINPDREAAIQKMVEALEALSNCGEIRIAVNHNEVFTQGSKAAYKITKEIANIALEAWKKANE